MIRTRTTTLLLLAALAPSTAAAAKPNKQLERLLALDPSHFQQTATVIDDALETTARISTERGFQFKGGLLKVVGDDNFLRAFIDKKTGLTQFQVYQIIPYSGNWRFYHTVNYETPEGPKSEELTVIDRSVTGCGRYGCSFVEHVGFTADESLLRTVAASYTPGMRAAWRFKLKAKAAEDWQDGIAPAEIAGLLAAVDAYKAAHGLNRQPAVNPVR
jgi:hypothetical protein